MDLMLLRRVEERSLLSILRSKLLTTFINNHVSGKVNAGGCARALGKFHAIADVFHVRIGGDQAPCLSNFVDVKSDFLSAERCPVTARPTGVAWNKKVSEGIRR
jgi:hypothetical protein